MWAADVAAGAVMLLGLVGTILPFLPGIPLIIAAALVWAAVTGAGAGGWVAVAIVILIGLAGMLVGTLIPARTTAAAGAPRWVLGVGALGVVVGFFAIPVVGALVGGPAAVFLAELVRLRDGTQATRATWAALQGMGLGIAIQFSAAVAMIAVWAVAVFFL